MAATLEKLFPKVGLKLNPGWDKGGNDNDVWKAFLEGDIAESTEFSSAEDFPAAQFSLETTTSTVKKHMIVQVEAVEDVGKPKYKPAGGVIVEDEELECGKYLGGTEKEAKTESGPKILKLSLKSGSLTFSALEMERIPALSPELEKKTKLLLKAPFTIRRSIVLLWKANCELLTSLDQLKKL